MNQIVRSLSQLVPVHRGCYYQRVEGVAKDEALASRGMRILTWRGMMLCAAVLCATLAVGTTAIAAAATTERVSVASGGAEGDLNSFDPSVSADGRYVAFASSARNLIAGDTNGTGDVFVHDRETGATERVSVASDGTQANGPSEEPSISADGRYVAFQSNALNLGGDPTSTNFRDVYVHDRETGATELVSVASGGVQGNSTSGKPSISADGRHVAFESSASNLVAGDTGFQDVFVHDRQTGATERVSVAADGDGAQANSHSGEPAIAADGRQVAFRSNATNLVAGDTNGRQDVFVRDRGTDATERVSVAGDGAQANGDSAGTSISADGRHVAFPSSASNLVAGDTNGRQDVFVHDRGTGATELVSVASDGAQANLDSSESPSVSADGRHVSFGSFATNLVAGDTNGTSDVFAHDRETGATELVSVASDGMPANGSSNLPSISADGRHVAFASLATNLVAGDTNGVRDVFVHGEASVQPANSTAPSISGTAREDQQLTASNGTWTGDEPISFTHQWRRCDSAGLNCADIAGATAQTHDLVAADVGSRIVVRVTGTNTAGSSSAESSPTAVVEAAPPPATAPANTSRPKITGTTRVGKKLKASPGTWTGTQPISVSYRWQRCNRKAKQCKTIAGATARAYKLRKADRGRRLRVAVTARNSAGRRTAVSAPSKVVK